MVPVVLGCVGGFVFLLIVLVFGAALIAGGDDSSTSSPSTTYSSYSSYSPSSYSSYSPSYPTETDTSTDLPTSTESPTDGGGGSGGSPEDNAVYDSGTMVGVGCTAKLPSVDAATYEQYVRDVIPCLNEAWKAQLSKESITFQEPSTIISRGENPTSPCGGSDVGYTPSAFYCPTNQTIYFNLPAATKDSSPGFAVRTAAHEYGHHVQELTGILEVSNQRREQNAGTEAEYEGTRRVELQAQCFAAMFLGGNADTMGTSKRNVVNNTGGDDYVEGSESDPSLRTHGSVANNKKWLRRGWPTDASTCNSWTASSTEVS